MHVILSQLKNWIPQLPVIDWFNYHYMKLNDSKCNLLVCGNKEEVIMAEIGNIFITETHEVKLLRTIIVCDLSFKKHTTPMSPYTFVISVTEHQISTTGLTTDTNI